MAENRVFTSGIQQDTMSSLTQQAAAWLLSISPRALRDQNAPRALDGTYNARDLVAWAISERTPDSSKLSQAKIRQAVARAITLEIAAERAQGNYVSTDEITQEFMSMAAAVRSELEAIPSNVRNDLPDGIRDPFILELRNQIQQILRRLANRGQQLVVDGVAE